MNISLQTLLKTKQSLDKIFTANLPIRISYKIRKFIYEINGELKHLEEERIALVEKYGEKDEKGNISVKKENITDFESQMTTLLKEEISINFDSISPESLGDISISAADVENLIKLGVLKEDKPSSNKKEND